MDDATLMRQVGDGDRGAFTTLFARHRGSILRMARRFTGNPARAEELAQDIFIKLYTSARRYRPTAAFKTFLFRIAINHCLNERRRAEHQVERATTDAPFEAHPSLHAAEKPDEALEARQLAKALSDALGQLRDNERLAFSLCRFDGLSYAEIARTLNVSEPAVKSLIHRASLAVAKRLAAHQSNQPSLRSTA